jgi:hypothetical protein
MYGLAFSERRNPARETAPRGDIALAIGWCAWRAAARTGVALSAFLHERLAREVAPGAALPLDAPLPFASWEAFDAVADWRGRAVAGSPEPADCPLGVAVRDFFANGGAQCYVIGLGSPPPLGLAPAFRDAAFARLLPDLVDRDRASWRGVAQLLALDEVALLLAPDLPELAASQADRLAPSRDAPDPPEVFVECGSHAEGRRGDPGLLRLPAPRCDDDDYARWRGYAQRLGDFLARHRRDCTALLALPLPAATARVARDARAAMDGLQSSFVQVAYPWLRPVQPPRTPEGLVAPDGALAGLVAATCIAQGAFRTAAGRAPADVYDVEPLPPPRELVTPAADAQAWTSRLSLFAPRLARIELLSDRTASDRAGWRNAAVGRLMGLLLRQARALGDALAFETAGEALFAAIRRRVEALLTSLWQQGALRGAQPAEAFAVRCDRTTMTQNDLDHGRVVCLVEFAPTYSLERIRVELTLTEAAGAGWRDAAALAEVVA